MKYKTLTALFVALIFCAQASAQTIIERLPDPALLGTGAISGNFVDQPGQAVSPLTVVTFTEEVTIDAVTIFTTNLNAAFPNVGYPVGSSGPVVFNVFVGTTLPFNADTLSGGQLGIASTPADYVETPNGIEITASGLDLTLPAGTFLIGLTPILNFGTNGQEFILDAGVNGQTTFLNNPGGALFDPIFGDETIDANQLDLPTQFTGQAIRITAEGADVLKGDVNGDGNINLLDVAPFVALVSDGIFQPEADVNCDGAVNLLDVSPFVALLSDGG